MGPTREERVVVWQRFVLDPDTPEDVYADSIQQALTRAELSGAEVLATLSGTLLLSFDGIELEDAIELARTEVAELRGKSDWLRVQIAIALGELETAWDPVRGRSLRGLAVDRAQTLANRARPGEIVLDEAAAQRAEELYLYARELIVGAIRGQALDPSHAHKRQCRGALARLSPAPLPASAATSLAALQAIARTPQQQRVAIHTDVPSAGRELVDHFADAIHPARYLRFGRKSGGYQPLGSLCVALRGLWPDDAALEASELPAEQKHSVAELLAGNSVLRSDAVDALVELCRWPAGPHGRPLLLLDPLHEIDPATLGVVAETVMMPELDLLLVMTVPSGVSVPAQLVPENELHRIDLPPITTHDAVVCAATVLGVEPESDVARRVAALGGESTLGIREAARTLVSAGDLVLQKERFGWRVAARSAAHALPVEALITERVAGLSGSAYRVLEALCVAPPDCTVDLLQQVLTRDGLPGEEVVAGVAQLQAEGFIEGQLGLGPADVAIRGALRNNMPAPRAAELHRFVSEVLMRERRLPGFGSGELAYHLAEGGLESEAAIALIDAAKAAAHTGFQRVALRLLATAVKLDNSADIRRAARELARTVDALLAPSAPPAAVSDEYEELKSEDLKPLANQGQSAMRSAVKALGDEDFEAVERWLDAAVAAGFGKAAAQRVLAITQLARGEMQNATQTLQGSSRADAAPAVRARDALSWALVHTLTGDVTLGVRDALESLSHNRRLADRNGEIAALHVLALCYRLLEREADASRITQAAQRLHASAGAGASSHG